MEREVALVRVNKHQLRRSLVLSSAMTMLIVLFAGPASAASAGGGAGIVTGGYASEETYHEVPASCGGEVKRADFVVEQVGDYSGANDDSDAAASYNGPSIARITVLEDHFFNELGTHTDENCAPPTEAVDATYRVDGTNQVGGTVHCEGSGEYMRTGVSTLLFVMDEGFCNVRTASTTPVVTFETDHVWEMESLPCFGEGGPPVPNHPRCDESQDYTQIIVGGTYEAGGADQ